MPTETLRLAPKSYKCGPSLLFQPHFQLFLPMPVKFVYSLQQHMPCTSSFETFSVLSPYPLS